MVLARTIHERFNVIVRRLGVDTQCGFTLFREVAINWVDQPGSKVGVLRDGPRMLAQIVTARARLALATKPGERS